jgi:hypothetical protein
MNIYIEGSDHGSSVYNARTNTMYRFCIFMCTNRKFRIDIREAVSGRITVSIATDSEGLRAGPAGRPGFDYR